MSHSHVAEPIDDLSAMLRTELAGRYELGGVLGRGGFGVVYRALHCNTGQTVAVKALRLAYDGSAAALERQTARFEREASLCAEVNHPNIVRLLERGRPDARVCFAVYEYVPGRTLAELLAERGALSAPEAVDIMAQVLDALACAHASGIIHRDLKPENIMVVERVPRSHVKVLDFGVGTLVPAARDVGFRDLTLTRDAVGTPSYSAPEQLRGEPATPRSDLYAWGLVLIECLIGQPVFQAATAAAIYHKQLSPHEVSLPRALAGHALGALLRRAVQKVPAQRAESAPELHAALRQLHVADLVGSLAARPRPETPRELFKAATTIAGAPSAAQELRHITVMCCSLELVRTPQADLGFELLDVLHREQVSRLHDTLVRHGGEVAWSLCDRCLVYFGYPLASDTDARRAARTALDLASDIERRSAELQQQTGVALVFRVALHSGMVRCDGIEQLPAGMTPSVALRAEALTPANTIAVTESTRRLLTRHAAFRELGVLPTAASAEGLTLHALTGERPADSLDAQGERCSQLWGRAREFELLAESLGEAHARCTASCVVLRGEPGIGKSRLVREFERHALERGLPVHRLRCTEEAQNAALSPVLALLRETWLEHARTPEDAAERVWEALLARGLDADVLTPIVCAWLLLPAPPQLAPCTRSPLRQRQLLLQAAVDILQQPHQTLPGLVVVEDLHWADSMTLEWFRLLGAAPCTLMLVGTTRPTLAPEALAARIVDLERLRPAECSAVMREIARSQGVELGDALLSSLTERADGIPLFAEELALAQCIASGAPPSPTAARPGLHASIPDTLRELLTGRLDTLGPAREVAQLAAAFGREFDASLLLAALRCEPAHLMQQLDCLVRADLVQRGRHLEREVYAFRHALVREAAYGSMPQELRRRAHAGIARALEHDAVDLRPRAAELHRHHHAAQAYASASKYALLAAEEALSKSSNQVALEYARSVLDAIAHVPVELRQATQLAAFRLTTQALLATEGWASASVRNAIERTNALLPAEHDGPEKLSTLYALFQHYHVASQRSACRSVVGQLSELGRRREDRTLLTTAATAEGVCCHAEGAFDSACEHLERARSLYRPGIDSPQQADNGLDCFVWATAQLALVEWNRGHAGRARSLAEQAIAEGRKLGHIPSLSIALLYISQINQFEGRRADAIATCNELLSLAATYGLPAFEAYAGVIRAWAHDDLAGVRAITKTLRAMNCNLILTYYGSFEADIEARRGNVSAALSQIDACLRLCGEIDEHCFEAELHRWRAGLLIKNSGAAQDQAEAALWQAITLARGQGMRRIEGMACADLLRLRSQQPVRQRLEQIVHERPSLLFLLGAVHGASVTEAP